MFNCQNVVICKNCNSLFPNENDITCDYCATSKNKFHRTAKLSSEQLHLLPRYLLERKFLKRLQISSAENLRVTFDASQANIAPTKTNMRY
jgi:hypothetical protein